MRSTYPKGGYLKVNKKHYHRLMNLDVMPRYKPKMHGDKMRIKRDHSGKNYEYNNISYCCFHLCDEEFFCWGMGAQSRDPKASQQLMPSISN